MFDKILIANRGEIACRVIDTCQKLGVATVAVHSDIDANARHVDLADEAVSLGGATPAESYLRTDAVIAAALATGAQAIHPGYGFLSENPDFVEAVEAAGLVFIGPSAEAIRAMGLKDAAKALMEKAGVPVVPGYHGADQDPEFLKSEAARIGYPVLIKAVAGGGGKGMRQVNAEAEFSDALSAAKSEAKNAFGNEDVLIEKFVSTPRHIEVQVFGDGQKAVHLFERDCSLQRRHQKVIEEAPAPGMTPEMRDAMGQAAVRAAEAVGYAGAGTVEFIVDASDGLREDRFYFMEMNTRLQVEHPVTEEITGVDLVEWQLRVSAGQPLPMAQDALSIQGHSFEARIYAEDAAAGFLPATGTLEHLKFAQGARIDTGVRQGDEISPYYDPMIAKLTVHGKTRDEALSALAKALAKTEIAGCTTNIAFLKALASHEGFAEGNVDTGLIARDLDLLLQTPTPCSRTCALAAITAMDIQPQPLQGFALWQPLRQQINLMRGDVLQTALIEPLGAGTFRVCPNVVHPETTHLIETGTAPKIDGDKVSANAVRGHDSVTVFWGNTYEFGLSDPLERSNDEAGGNETRAPMPGLVKAVFVKAGDVVREGDRLAILEAMKMEHTLCAARDGVIEAVSATENTQVSAGDILIELASEDAP